MVNPTSRVSNAFEMALWVATLAPRQLIDRAERMQIDTGLPTCDIQNEVWSRLSEERFGISTATGMNVGQSAVGDDEIEARNEVLEMTIRSP